MEVTPLNNDIAVKQANRLIESIYKMDVNEHKLLLLATKKVNEMELRNQPFSERTRIVISSSEFAQQYGISRQSAFEIIVEAKRTIYDREFDYLHVDPSGEIIPMKSSWFQARAEDKAKGEVSFLFASAVIPLIYLVESEYTLLDLTEIGKLKSKYAVRLYKYLMRWVNAPYRNPIPIDKLREIFGLTEGEYPEMRDFKKRVLDLAVKQVKEGTGFKDLAVTSYKTGVKITSVSFHYTEYSNNLIKKAKTNIIDAGTDAGAEEDYKITYMTAQQIKTFSNSIAKKIAESETGFGIYSHLAVAGQPTSVLAKKIAKDFETFNFDPWIDALKLIGFKPTKINKTLAVGEPKADDEGDGDDAPFKLKKKHFELYKAKGGKMTHEKIIEIAMAEDITPLQVINREVNIFAA